MVYKLVSRVGALLMLAAIAIMFCPTSVWALGPAAPPRITFAAAWVNTLSTNAFVSSEERFGE